MKRRIVHYFNLIEIAMALGMIGFGVSSIMSVIPASLQNAGISVSENYAANTADIFFSYINKSLRSDSSIYYPAGYKDNSVFESTVSSLITQTSKPAALSGDDKYSASATSTAENIGTSSLDDNDPILKNIFDGASGVFKVVQGSDPDEPEFSAIIRVWRKNITNTGIKVMNNTNSYDGSINMTLVGGSESVAGIFVEVSWPAHKPYGMRDSHLYYKEIYDNYE